ncbi:hypothetical protein DCO56_23315 [Sphingobacterium athyrii]|uniref:DUF4293 domain-containing protein n=2 Tax=Sphingobacterium athyrii TaxID=2152717 RepID=A0A363NM89_9SPHI|nr:hypothetical protein DCO56_23315 [Sphingobacterium athyrii]
MVIIRKYFAIVGLIICFLSSMTPFLKVPIKGNWNLYQVDAYLFFITMLILGIIALLFFVRAVRAYQWMTRLSVCWYLVSITAVWFKINNYFGWGFADKLLSKSLHMRWGWIVYLIGILLLLLSTKKIVSTNE